MVPYWSRVVCLMGRCILQIAGGEEEAKMQLTTNARLFSTLLGLDWMMEKGM
jgi:hypothetical protein